MRKYASFSVAVMFTVVLSGIIATGCGHSDSERERADSLLAAAETLELQGYGAVGSEAEVEKYYIEALTNCREAASLGAPAEKMAAHLKGNLLAIRRVVESQVELAAGMPLAQEALNKRIARIDSALVE